MNQGYSYKNLSNKLTKGQKIGAMAMVIIMLLLVVLLSLIVNSKDENVGENGGIANEGGSDYVEGEELVIDGMNYVVKKESVEGEDGKYTEREVKEDEYGNVTTVDPNLITTYFPYQKMRAHSDWEDTLRYSLELDEEYKIINASIEYCDEAGNKEMIQQYLDSIPLDLSSYAVNYELFSEDAICTDEVGWGD